MVTRGPDHTVIINSQTTDPVAVGKAVGREIDFQLKSDDAPDRMHQLVRIAGGAIVVIGAALVISLGVWGVVAIWRAILG